MVWTSLKEEFKKIFKKINKKIKLFHVVFLQFREKDLKRLKKGHLHGRARSSDNLELVRHTRHCFPIMFPIIFQTFKNSSLHLTLKVSYPPCLSSLNTYLQYSSIQLQSGKSATFYLILTKDFYARISMHGRVFTPKSRSIVS